MTDTGDTTHRGKTVQAGKKTRITTSAKEIPEHPTGTGDPALDIQQIRELKDTCK